MRDAFSNNEDAPTKPNLGEFLFEILWLYFYEVVIAPVNEVCSADIVAMMPQTPHCLVLSPRQASVYLLHWHNLHQHKDAPNNLEGHGALRTGLASQ